MSSVEFTDNGIFFMMLSATSLDTFFSKLCFNLINSSISNVGETCFGIEKLFMFFLPKSISVTSIITVKAFADKYKSGGHPLEL